MNIDSLSGAALVAALAITATVGIATAFVTDRAEGDSRYRVVFHVNTGGTEYWESALGNVANLREELGAADTEVEVVAHGKGLDLVMATNESLAEQMAELAEQGVVFAACENTMKKRDVTKEQLLPFVTTVGSGVAQLVRRQEEGWAYVKP